LGHGFERGNHIQNAATLRRVNLEYLSFIGKWVKEGQEYVTDDNKAQSLNIAWRVEVLAVKRDRQRADSIERSLGLLS
jgi:hypothetical protein